MSRQQPSPRGTADRRNPATLFVLLAISIVALAVRLPGLGHSELWVDEAATWWFGRMIAEGGFFESLMLEPTPPLYYLLTGGVLRIFGDSELVLRLPAVVFGVLSILATYLLSAELFDRRVALWSSAILAIHPLHVFYSREARVYPLLTLLFPLAVWLAIRTARQGRWNTAAGLFGVLVLLCHSHMYALFALPVVLGAGCLFLPKGARRRNFMLLLLAGVGAAVLWLPYLLLTLPKLSGSGAAWSVTAFYERHPEERNLLRSFAQLLVGANYHEDLRSLSLRRVVPWMWLPAIAFQGLLFCLAIVRSWRTDKRRSLLALALGWPLLILPPWLMTMLGRPMYLSGRHDVLCLGFVSCWLALGIVELLDRGRAAAELRSRRSNLVRWCTIPSLLFFGLLALQRLTWMYIDVKPHNHDLTAKVLATSASPGDVVVATGIRRLVTQYYTGRALRQDGLAVELWRERPAPDPLKVNFVSFPRSTDLHPGWSDALTLLEDEEALAKDGAALVAAVGHGGLSSRGGSIWTLERNYPEAEGALSINFLVDRHLESALLASGYSVSSANTEQRVRRWQRQP